MRDLLAQLAGEPSATAVFVDFDGSLAPIVEDPAGARAVKGATDVLNALAKELRLVAVVSGRPVQFLSDRLGTKGVRLVGLYGIEERVGRSLRVLPQAQAARGAILAAEHRLRALLPAEAYVEPKGFAISVHFRRADDPVAAMRENESIVRGVAEEQGLRFSAGRLVWEISPETDVEGKGGVVRRLVEQHGIRRALVAGDDRGDIAMFEAVADLEVAIRVGVASAEMPAELRALSDLVVPGPEALVPLLKELTRLVD